MRLKRLNTLFRQLDTQVIRRVASLVRAAVESAPNTTTTTGRLFKVVCMTTQRPASLI